MNASRWHLVVAALAAAVLMLPALLPVPQPPGLAAAPVAPTAAVRPTAIPLQEVPSSPAAAPASPEAAPAAPSPSAGLLADFTRATDYRQFALAAMQRPAEGGLFYARFALSRCIGEADGATLDHGIRKAIAETGTVSQLQLDVGQRAMRRCASFGRGEADALFVQTMRQSRDGLDPLLQVESDLRAAGKSGDTALLHRATVRLLDIGDPLLLGASLVIASRSDPQAHAVDGLRFGNRVLTEDEPDQALAIVAMHVGTCRDGVPCVMDVLEYMQCTMQGICYGNRDASVRGMLEQEHLTPEQVDRFHAYVARVRRAIDEKDTAFFVR